MPGGQVTEPAEQLLGAAGYEGPYHSETLSGGKNNQVFRIDTASGAVVLKSYFHHALDQRDRLGAEWAFSRFAWDRGIRCLPRPIASDPCHRIALFEYIDGRRISAGEVRRELIEQAIRFVEALNQERRSPDGEALPDGSEACFTLTDHLDCVSRRIQRLQGAAASLSDPGLAEFVDRELVPCWFELRAALHSRRKRAGAGRAGVGMEEPLSLPERCVSPSDFGYHNALELTGGELRFLDFEYAGWDDPARMVCDFFCQPAVPAGLERLDQFALRVSELFPRPELCRERIHWLLPLYQVKWCCIVLNHFLQEGSDRRRFAGGGDRLEDERPCQLALARECLRRVSALSTVP